MADKFFYLKLGNGNCLAEYWLNLEEKIPNVLNGPAAAIYFGTITTEKITPLIDKPYEEAKEQFKLLTESRDKPKGNRDFKAVKDFFTAGYNAGKTENGETKFVTISRGIVYIYEPKDGVSDMPEGKYDAYDDDLDKLAEAEKNKAVAEKIEGMKVERKRQDGPKHIPKIMPVKNVKEYEVKDVPHVLASLSCNQYYSQGTCRKINDWGAIQAIKHVLCQKKIIVSEDKLIELLSPYELETLVFLILKNEGLFVPAWRGGTQKDIDIIARNLTNNEIRISKIIFEPKESKTFQVKKDIEKDIRGKIPPEVRANFLVIANSKQKLFRNKKNLDDQWLRFKEEKILDANWLLEQIKSEKQQETRKWLINSLEWVKDIRMLIENTKTL